jgi:flagellar operon protein
MSEISKFTNPLGPPGVTSGFGGTQGSTRVPGAESSDILKGPSFQEALKKIEKGGIDNSSSGLKSEVKTESASKIKFSNHAVERMQTRGVRFSPEDLKKIESAVEKAAAKGSKDSLVLMNDTALIVSVKNNTVVTVVDKNSLKENVFTNIDSTVVV